MHALVRLACQPLTYALGLALPRKCIGCGLHLSTQTESMCVPCTVTLPGLLNRRCPHCATTLRQSSNTNPGSTCGQCARHKPAFDASFALCDYASPVDAMVQALKFQRQWSLGPALGIVIGQRRGNAILDCALELAHQRPCEKSIHRPYLTKNRPTIQLCAIPLSAHRMIERGFNQSELILNGLRDSLEQNPLARHLVIQRKNVLARRRDTVAQTLIEPSMREQNLKNAFDVRGSCENQIIVLVDDVMTSGATLASAAQTLKSAGALAVINAVAARTA